MMIRKIFLIGMPGSGKTTLGKKLADVLGIPFIDQDKIIEEEEGKSVAEIFSIKGEDYFRVTERKILHRINEVYNEFVLATGGGAPCFFDNTTYINESGTSIYLEVKPEELAKRMLKNGIEDRPLLKGIDPATLIEELTKKLDWRQPYYQQAALTIKGNKINVNDLVKALEEKEA